MSFSKNMGKNICNNICKNLSGKSSQKPLDHINKYAADAFKTSSKRVIQEAAQANGDLIGSKIVADRITIVSKIHNKIIQI